MHKVNKLECEDHGREAPRRGRQTRARSVDELTRRNVDTIIRLEEATKAGRTRAERVADGITRFCGSMTFVWLHVIWYGAWIGANVLLPAGQRFDPFPFSFLTLVVSLEAIFLATFILLSQNRQKALDDRRAQLDLQVNLLSEQENTKMLELLERIARQVGVDVSDDAEVRAFEEATRPQKVLQQIEQSMAKNGKA
jgi:uncharacterized membrane protein